MRRRNFHEFSTNFSHLKLFFKTNILYLRASTIFGKYKKITENHSTSQITKKKNAKHFSMRPRNFHEINMKFSHLKLFFKTSILYLRASTIFGKYRKNHRKS